MTKARAFAMALAEHLGHDRLAGPAVEAVHVDIAGPGDVAVDDYWQDNRLCGAGLVVGLALAVHEDAVAGPRGGGPFGVVRGADHGAVNRAQYSPKRSWIRTSSAVAIL